MQFIMGLNESFDSVRSQILMIDPLIYVNKVYSMLLRATPMRVAIRGATSITAKMIPQRHKIRLQWRWHQRWQNFIQGFGVAYLTTFDGEWRGCKIAVDDYCSSQRLYFISYLTTLIIFFNKNIELLK